MPAGTEFIKHEFDEAIAIQRSIIQSGERLSTAHPVEEVKRQLKADLKVDKDHLKQLEKFGKPFGAKGEEEEVAGALSKLASETSQKASTDESEAYEAHAVLLNLKRKQQDSADAVVKIARDRDEKELRDAATEMKKQIKTSADALAKSLADFAVRIAQA
jgi:di/tripeptidase